MFYKYLDAEKLMHKPGGRCAMFDEAGEGTIGILESFAASSEDQIIRATQLYQVRSELQKWRSHAEAPNELNLGSSPTMMDDTQAIMLLVSHLEKHRPPHKRC